MFSSPSLPSPLSPLPPPSSLRRPCPVLPLRSADAHEADLLNSAYNSLAMLVQQAPLDCRPTITAMLPPVLERLRAAVTVQQQALAAGNVPGAAEAVAKNVRIQELLCGVLQHMLRKMADTTVKAAADEIMLLVLEILKGQSASVLEESLMVVTSLIGKVGPDFIKYMQAFAPYLAHGLRAHNEKHVCIIAVGIVSELVEILGAQMLPMCNDIVQTMLTNLQVRSPAARGVWTMARGAVVCVLFRLLRSISLALLSAFACDLASSIFLIPLLVLSSLSFPLVVAAFLLVLRTRTRTATSSRSSSRALATWRWRCRATLSPTCRS
jgi:hypothetical protein